MLIGYASFFATQYFEGTPGPTVAFYGRYIDDCLGIVYAKDQVETVNIISSAVKVEGVEFTWEAYNYYVAFLDLWVYICSHLLFKWLVSWAEIANAMNKYNNDTSFCFCSLHASIFNIASSRLEYQISCMCVQCAVLILERSFDRSKHSVNTSLVPVNLNSSYAAVSNMLLKFRKRYQIA